MKAIKKNFENLQAIVEQIVSVPFSSGEFSIECECCEQNYIHLVSKRDSIGSTILSMIPCNYCYRISFVHSVLELHIWFE